MKHFSKIFGTLAIAALLYVSPTARADEWNKRTVVTINEPIAVPNMVLPAGTYVFRLLDSPSDRHIVQIFNKDETHLFATILAIPNYRLTPTGHTVFTFWETPSDQPKQVRAWFYPGDNYGQEFAYSRKAAQQIAANTSQPVITSSAQTPQEMRNSQVQTMNQSGQTAQLGQNYSQPTPAPAPPPQVAETQPAPQAPPAAEPAPEPAPEPVPQPAQLPKTASDTPLVGLFGLLAIAGYFALRTRVS